MPSSKTANPPPLSGASLVLATIALSLAVFMMVLDSTIANVALPTIAGDLGAATSQGTWVITMFAVSNAIAIPLTGFLAQRFGEVRVFLISGVLFVFCSWLCGIAHNLIELIIFRICQGAVAGPMIPLAQSLLLPVLRSLLGLSLLRAFKPDVVVRRFGFGRDVPRNVYEHDGSVEAHRADGSKIDGELIEPQEPRRHG